MKLDFTDDVVLGPNGPIRAEWPVADARLVGGRIVVLGNESRNVAGPLAAYDAEGKRLWRAETPEAGDGFVHIYSEEPLRANTWSCHLCTIDADTGRIVESQFTK